MPKRGRKAPAVPVKGGWDVLPHNMGVAPGKRNAQATPSVASLEELPTITSTQEPLLPNPTQASLRTLDQYTSTDTSTNTSEGTATQSIVSEPANIEANDTQKGGRQPLPRKAKTKLEAPTEVVVGDPKAEAHEPTKVPMKRKRNTKTGSLAEDEELEPDVLEPKPKKEKRKARKTKDNPYGLTPGETPFPEWQAPSAKQCEDVYRLLADMHDDVQPQAPEVIPAPSLEITGCGEVPSVLDALIRTLLSGATTFANAGKMLQGLVQKFGTLEEGIGKGSIDWNNVRLSPLEDVVEAIRMGGLANNKAKNIKAILDVVYQENIERREAYLAEKESGMQATVFGASEKTEGQKKLEILKADQNILSLDHMHGLPAHEAMKQFTKYPGIGVKTSACVILFCLQRPCFAVDTHVDKFSKWLGWAPEKATENDVFSHLEVRCPDHLKYGLHQLFIRHGQTCGKCKRSTVEGTDEWKVLVCPLDDLLVRFDKRQSRAKPKPPKKKKGENLDSLNAAANLTEQGETQVKKEEYEEETK
ncbi:DNA glycosylase [Whalleya microplaca]|nr:DNA glycosylase [Whalleya microplaca]